MLLIRLAVFVFLPILANAGMVGDFAPLGVGDKWIYFGAVSEYSDHGLVSELGVLSRRTDSVYRKIEVVGVETAGDTSRFRIRKDDSVFLRTKSYRFLTIDSSGLAHGRVADSIERRDSNSTESVSVMAVRGEIVPGQPDCKCAPVGFLENMFQHRLYADSQLSDTSYRSEIRKYVSGGTGSAAMIGFSLRWTKVQGVGLAAYDHSWWGSTLSWSQTYTLASFNDTLSSFTGLKPFSGRTGKSKSAYPRPGPILDYRDMEFDVTGRRVGIKKPESLPIHRW